MPEIETHTADRQQSQADKQHDKQADEQAQQTPRSGPAQADRHFVTEEVRARNKPSGTHYVEPSPLGIEPVEQTGVDVQTNPPRSSERPQQTPEVPLGTGGHAEPPGGGGRESQQK